MQAQPWLIIFSSTILLIKRPTTVTLLLKKARGVLLLLCRVPPKPANSHTNGVTHRCSFCHITLYFLRRSKPASAIFRPCTRVVQHRYSMQWVFNPIRHRAFGLMKGICITLSSSLFFCLHSQSKFQLLYSAPTFKTANAPRLLHTTICLP